MAHRHIFRLSYYKNIEQFLSDGAVWAKNHQPMQRCYRTSHPDIVSRRGMDFYTPCNRNINDFVPFYFSPITNMFYGICAGSVTLVDPAGQQHGNAAGKDIVFIVCNTERIQNSGSVFWYTDVACNSNALAPTYVDDLTLLDSHIRWDLFTEHPIKGRIEEIGYLGACKWTHNRDDGRHNNRKSLRMAEFMVKDLLPLGLVDCIIVQNNDIRRIIESWIRESVFDIPVYVKRGCYF